MPSEEPTPLLAAIGQRLRDQRSSRGLTQASLAQQAGVSPRFLVQLEAGQGNISISRLADICAALDLSLSDLLRGLGPGVPDKIALVGMRGAGKSTVGAALSQHLGVPFLELDDQIADLAGLSLAEVFEVGGSSLYRELEVRAIRQALDSPGPAVLAAGGSVVTSPEAWHLLRARARTVWLRAAPDAHLRRVQAQGDTRPMAGRPDALRELTEILSARAPLYALADLTLDTDALGQSGVVDRLVAWATAALPAAPPVK